MGDKLDVKLNNEALSDRIEVNPGTPMIEKTLRDGGMVAIASADVADAAAIGGVDPKDLIVGLGKSSRREPIYGPDAKQTPPEEATGKLLELLPPDINLPHTVKILCADLSLGSAGTPDAALVLERFDRALENGKVDEKARPATAFILLSLLAAANASDLEKKQASGQPMGRRDFLKMFGTTFLAAGALAAGVHGTRLPEDLADSSEDPRMKEFLEGISNVFKGVNPPDLEDFRLCLMMEKCNAAVEQGLVPDGLPLPIVMDKRMERKWNEFSQDTEKRTAVLTNFMEYVRGGIEYAVGTARRTFPDTDFKGAGDAAGEAFISQALMFGVVEITDRSTATADLHFAPNLKILADILYGTYETSK